MVQTLLNLLATAFYYLFHRLELLRRLRHPIHRELALQPSESGCLTTLCQIYRLVSETALDTLRGIMISDAQQQELIVNTLAVIGGI